MLSVPPAFVLSQDQTLNQIVSKILSDSMILFAQLYFAVRADIFTSSAWLKLLQLLKVFPRVLFRLLFNFQDTDVTSTLRRATLLSYHTFCFLSSLFRDIFCRPIFLSDSLFIIPPFRPIVKGFSAILSHFVNFYIYIKNPLTFLFIQSNRPAKA